MLLQEDVNIIVTLTNALINSYGYTFDSKYDVLLNDINEGSCDLDSGTMSILPDSYPDGQPITGRAQVPFPLENKMEKYD